MAHWIIIISVLIQFNFSPHFRFAVADYPSPNSASDTVELEKDELFKLEQSNDFLNIISQNRYTNGYGKDLEGDYGTKYANLSGEAVSAGLDEEEMVVQKSRQKDRDRRRKPQTDGIDDKLEYNNGQTKAKRRLNRRRNSKKKNYSRNSNNNSSLALVSKPSEPGGGSPLDNGLDEKPTTKNEVVSVDSGEERKSRKTISRRRKVKRRRKVVVSRDKDEARDSDLEKRRKLLKEKRLMRRLVAEQERQFQKAETERLLSAQRQKRRDLKQKQRAEMREQRRIDRLHKRRYNFVQPRNMSNDESGTSGDLSCMKSIFKHAPPVPNADVKYIRNDLLGVDNSFLEAEYHCHEGFQLRGGGGRVICRNYSWLGDIPICHRIEVTTLIKVNETICPNANSICEQMCFIDQDGIEKCSCYKGFHLVTGRCVDINECLQSESVCEFGCVNMIGSYRCKCPKGMKLSFDRNHCVDVNECLLRNGHGPCQDVCRNTWGGFNCSCDNLPGTKLSADGQGCEEVDECANNNGGCSHTCLNTKGRVFCVCPDGWIIDDNDPKTCIDVDECQHQDLLRPEQRCEYSCVNTMGSYNCVNDFGADQPIIEEIISCPNGFTYNVTTENCDDLDECRINNGGCFDMCTNTVGSFHCSCKPGLVFASDKYTCTVSNATSSVVCPPLFPPRHGYLECSRPIGQATEDSGGSRRRITNSPGSQCILRCPTGFRVVGKFSKICGSDGNWMGGEADSTPGACVRYPAPNMICPWDVRMEIPANEALARMRVPRPKTDVRDRDIAVDPDWARKGELQLDVGTFNVTYTARHPVSKLTVSCTFSITVMDGKPPEVVFCPETQKYTIGNQYENVQVSWQEPRFLDNVNVTNIMRTNVPDSYFGLGSHQVTYQATDAAGYSSKCVFKIVINLPKWNTFNYLQLPRNFN